MSTILEHAAGVLHRHCERSGTSRCGTCGRPWAPARWGRIAGCRMRRAAQAALLAAEDAAALLHDGGSVTPVMVVKPGLENRRDGDLGNPGQSEPTARRSEPPYADQERKGVGDDN